MSPLIYSLSEPALICPISALCEKNNPPVSEERDSEKPTIYLDIERKISKINRLIDIYIEYADQLE